MFLSGASQPEVTSSPFFICRDAKFHFARKDHLPLLDDAKSPLPVDVRRSKTPLLKFPTEEWGMLGGVRLSYKKVIKS